MTILERIASYLENGGLFNPEMMEHDKVRELIMDVRTQLTPQPMHNAPTDKVILIFLPRHSVWTTGHFVAPDSRFSTSRPSNWWSGVLDSFVEPSHWLFLPPPPCPKPIELIPGIYV